MKITESSHDRKEGEKGETHLAVGSMYNIHSWHSERFFFVRVVRLRQIAEMTQHLFMGREGDEGDCVDATDGCPLCAVIK